MGYATLGGGATGATPKSTLSSAFSVAPASRAGVLMPYPVSKPAAPSPTTAAPQQQTPATQAYADFTKAFHAPQPVAPPQPVTPAPIVAPVATPAPTITPARVEIPTGTYEGFQDAFYHSAYDPVSRSLEIQKNKDLQSLQSQLAQAGLADSGVAIGQSGRVASDYAERDLAASQQAANQAAQARYSAEIEAAGKNADYAQQAGIQNATNALQLSLANAGFSLDAQKANAANVLQGNIANAQNYLQTIGLNAQTAAQYRDDFLKFFSTEQQGAIANSQAGLALFNAYLQQKKIDADIAASRAAADLEKQKVALQRELGLGQNAIAQQEANAKTTGANAEVLNAEANAADKGLFGEPGFQTMKGGGFVGNVPIRRSGQVPGAGTAIPGQPYRGLGF